MAEPKTRPTNASVSKFLAAVADERLRADSQVVLKMMKQATRAEPRMWGPSIVGFGIQPVVYANGRVVDWPACAFSPRKSGLVLYLYGLSKQGALLKKLGRHKIGKSCLYLGPLDQLDLPTLKALIVAGKAKSKQSQRGL